MLERDRARTADPGSADGPSEKPEAELPEFTLYGADPTDPGEGEGYEQLAGPDVEFFWPAKPDESARAEADLRADLEHIPESGRHRRYPLGSPAQPAVWRPIGRRRVRLATVTAGPAAVVIGAVVYLAAPTSLVAAPASLVAAPSAAARESAAVAPRSHPGLAIPATTAPAPPAAPAAQHSPAPTVPVITLFPNSPPSTTLPIPVPAPTVSVSQPATSPSPAATPTASPTASPSPMSSSPATSSSPAPSSPAPSPTSGSATPTPSVSDGTGSPTPAPSSS